jgi:starch phosphorylase
LQFIKFVSTLGHFLEKDPDSNKHLRLIFLPNYTTSKEYRFVAALDVNEQLLLPGKQGCSSQALKFAMNGSILLGSRDSTNLRISNTLGENVAVLFG